jgi:hypothetical protein
MPMVGMGRVRWRVWGEGQNRRTNTALEDCMYTVGAF